MLWASCAVREGNRRGGGRRTSGGGYLIGVRTGWCEKEGTALTAQQRQEHQRRRNKKGPPPFRLVLEA